MDACNISVSSEGQAGDTAVEAMRSGQRRVGIGNAQVLMKMRAADEDIPNHRPGYD